MLYDCMTLRACFNLFILTNIDRCRPYFLHGLRLKVLPSSKVRNGTQQTQQSSSVTHSSPLGLEDEIADLVCLHTLCLHLCWFVLQFWQFISYPQILWLDLLNPDLYTFSIHWFSICGCSPLLPRNTKPCWSCWLTVGSCAWQLPARGKFGG